jgi:hypothetical protein
MSQVLRTQSVSIDGTVAEEQEITVADTAEASAILAAELVNSASDTFLHLALSEWFREGKVSNLHEGGEMFWSANLIEVAE